MGVCSLQPAPRLIFTHSNRFGLVAPRSKPPSENELAEVSYVCSQPSFHPTELQSPLHSSKLQPSSIRQDSIHHESMNGQCDMFAQIPEFPNLSLISSFQDLRDQFSMFYPLCEPLAPLVPLDFPLNFPLFSLLFPLSSLMDHDLLCLPLPDDCLPVLFRASQSR